MTAISKLVELDFTAQQPCYANRLMRLMRQLGPELLCRRGEVRVSIVYTNAQRRPQPLSQAVQGPRQFFSVLNVAQPSGLYSSHGLVAHWTMFHSGDYSFRDLAPHRQLYIVRSSSGSICNR